MREFDDIVTPDRHWLFTEFRHVVVLLQFARVDLSSSATMSLRRRVPIKTPRKTLLIPSQMVLYSLVMG